MRSIPFAKVAVVLVAAVAYGWWVTGLPPFSASATMAVLGGGLLAAALGRRHGPVAPVARSGRAARRDVAAWAVLVSALTAWQVAALVQSPRSDHPTLSSLTNTALDPRPLRTLAVAAWLVGAAWLRR